MKKKTKFNMDESQIRCNIKDGYTVGLKIIEKRKTNGPLVSNHPTFGVAGGKYCTGPPGRARSPGVGDSLYPDHPPNGFACLAITEKDEYLVQHGHFNQVRIFPEIYFNTEYQLVINNKKQIFINNQIFKIMKKQILILGFFVLAMIAGSLTSFGQALLPSNIPPVVGACVSDALHPKAGTAYNYTVSNTNTVVPTDYSWWITKNPQFVVPATGGADQTGKLVVAAGQLIATTALGAADGNSISVTWSPEILSNTAYQGTPSTTVFPSPTFVVVMANGTCNNNIQVYEIDPSPSFTVDITNIDATDATLGYGTDAPQCVDQVRGATYTAGTPDITMDYGTNTLYYEVISANFVTSWRPQFQIQAGSLNATQTADISWYPTLADAKANTNVIQSFPAQVDGAIVGGVAATPLTTAAANTSTGVSVYVKVVVHNNKYETIADNPVTLIVDGIDSTNQWDLVNADCSDPAAADQADTSTQTITRRPDVLDNSGPGVLAPSFVPKN
jgi:hypothetical protein